MGVSSRVVIYRIVGIKDSSKTVVSKSDLGRPLLIANFDSQYKLSLLDY